MVKNKRNILGLGQIQKKVYRQKNFIDLVSELPNYWDVYRMK